MRRSATVLTVLAVSALPLTGQTIESRVAQVRDGSIRMSFAAREGVCGSGRNFYTGRERSDHWEPDCDSEPVMVRLERRDGETVRIHTYIGGRWRPQADATDLGTVPARDAGRFFLAHAQTESHSAEEAIVPAALADSITIWPDLARIARDPAPRLAVRKASLFWIAQLGDDTVVDLLLDIMRSARDHELREHAVFAVSQHGSGRAGAALRTMAEDRAEGTEIRKKAIFWLGQRGQDADYLITLYDRLDSQELNEHLLFVLSQRRSDDAAIDKLIEVARNDSDRALQRKAIFWLGQTKHPRAVEFLAELIG